MTRELTKKIVIHFRASFAAVQSPVTLNLSDRASISPALIILALVSANCFTNNN